MVFAGWKCRARGRVVGRGEAGKERVDSAGAVHYAKNALWSCGASDGATWRAMDLSRTKRSEERVSPLA